jgi:hypothetical protein
MKSFNVLFSLIVISMVIANVAMAGPGGPPPTPTPIDGGLGLVLAGCFGYGAKKIHERRKLKK